MLPTPKTSTEHMLKALADKINGTEPVIVTPISNTDKMIKGIIDKLDDNNLDLPTPISNSDYYLKSIAENLSLSSGGVSPADSLFLKYKFPIDDLTPKDYDTYIILQYPDEIRLYFINGHVTFLSSYGYPRASESGYARYHLIGDSWVFQSTSTSRLGAVSAVGGFDGTLEVYHHALDDNGEIAKKGIGGYVDWFDNLIKEQG